MKEAIKKKQIIVIRKAEQPEVYRCGCLSEYVVCRNPVVQTF